MKIANTNTVFKKKFWVRLALDGIAVLLLVGSLLWAMASLNRPGLHTSHDSEAHVTRLIAFENALHDGQWWPTWSNRFFEGMGSPVLMLNYAFPYWIMMGFRWLGFGYFDSYKLALAATFIFAGIFWYWAARRQFGILASLVSAFIYTWAPYRFLLVYVRGAIGEVSALMWVPLVWGGLNSGLIWLAGLAFAGLILSHPVVTAMVCGWQLGYGIWQWWWQKETRWLRDFFLALGIGCLMAGISVVPTIWYTKDTGYSPNNSHPLNHFPTLQQLIYSPWGYGFSTEDTHDLMSYQVGIVHWLLLIVGTLAIGWFVWLAWHRRLAKSTSERNLTFALTAELTYQSLVAWASIFLMLPVSTLIWKATFLIKIIDFPWRLLSISLWTTAIIAAVSVELLVFQVSHQKIFKVFRRYAWYIGFSWSFFLIALVLFCNRNHIRVNQFWPWDESYYLKNIGTGDAFGEYAPRWRKTWGSIRFDQPGTVLGNEPALLDAHQTSREIELVVAATSATAVRYNHFYFPGWQYTIDDWNVAPNQASPCEITRSMKFGRDLSGMVVCWVSPGVHVLQAHWKAPIGFWVGALVSIIGIGIWLKWLFLWWFPPTMKSRE